MSGEWCVVRVVKSLEDDTEEEGEEEEEEEEEEDRIW